MRFLLKIVSVIDAFSEILGKLSGLLVLLVIAIGFYNVVVRYLGRFMGTSLSSNVFIELQWYLYSLIFLLAFPYILKHNVNVRVDLLYARWPRRRQLWVDLLGTLFFLIPFCIVGIWVAYNPVMMSWGRLPGGGWGTWEMSPDPSGLPRAPIKTMIIFAFATLLLQAIAQVIKYIAALRGNEEVIEALGYEDAFAGTPDIAVLPDAFDAN
jgi:TRAP-type mannitol/chloroaromatic compound transport system permease small subunit